MGCELVLSGEDEPDAMTGKLITPYVGVLTVHLRLTFSASLKDRRKVVRSLLDRIRNRWDVSAMDMGPDNDWVNAVLAFSAVGTSRSMADERLGSVRDFLYGEEEYGEFEVLDSRQEVNSF